MSTQITVRLPDDLVQFVDDEVKRGGPASRAAVVSRALERERRRRIAERDAAILADGVQEDDLSELAEFSVHVALDVD